MSVKPPGLAGLRGVRSGHISPSGAHSRLLAECRIGFRIRCCAKANDTQSAQEIGFIPDVIRDADHTSSPRACYFLFKARFPPCTQGGFGS